ncbi:hypothetical protein ACLMJK_005751 [Lecanora helva]
MAPKSPQNMTRQAIEAHYAELQYNQPRHANPDVDAALGTNDSDRARNIAVSKKLIVHFMEEYKMDARQAKAAVEREMTDKCPSNPWDAPSPGYLQRQARKRQEAWEREQARKRGEAQALEEEQKYQGALYKEKPSKKSVKISEPKQRPQSAYVEDAPDVDNAKAITIVEAPPAAPSPPYARHSRPEQPVEPVNVFDFLVTGDTPNATPHATPNPSKAEPTEDDEPMQMVKNAPKLFTNGDSQGHKEKNKRTPKEEQYETQGYTYGEDPVPVAPERPMIEYITPGPKHKHHKSKDSSYSIDDSQKKSTDKKRKRGHVEELDLTIARQPSVGSEILMDDAPPAILHSGLTGGLNRLLSKSELPPSPEYSNEDPSPPTIVKRSKRSINGKGEGISRGRNGALVKVRKRRSSDESRPPKKQHRSHHSPEHRSSTRDRPKHKAIEDRPKRKAIEYHPQSHHADNEDSQQQLVVYKSRAELFMSFVTKGPESDQGYSVHKALKRYHRERGHQGAGLGKLDEEKELFKNLRLKRNDRGEVVVFF